MMGWIKNRRCTLHPPKDIGAAAQDRQPLHVLVALKSTRKMRTGATRSILSAARPLAALGMHLHFVPVRTILHFLPALLRHGRVRYDLVLMNGLGSISRESRFGYGLWLVARALRLPVFLYWHETDWVLERYQREDPGGAQRVARIGRDPATAHLAASEACRHSIQTQYPAARPAVIYECASVPEPFDRPLPPAEPPLVVNIATIQERKGPDLFIATAIQVCQQHDTVEFLWLGSGQVPSPWQTKIEEAGLEHRILFPGYVEAPYLLLRRASLFFLSSRDDPFPLSVLEAMCLGRSIVVFDVGGAPEALAGLGHVIPSFHTDEAAEAILRCLRLPPEQRLNLELRQRYLDLYTPEAFARRVNQVLREHIARDH